jgi:pyruvate ferredoxin oxidoreductase beta subunit
MVAHGIPYVAQSTYIGNMHDLHEKSRKAIYTPGPAFLNVLSPCPRGWRYPASDVAAVVKAAVDSCVWPMFEVENGVYHLTYEPRHKLPVEDYLKLQGRFAHMFKSGNEWMIEQTQQWVDQQWNTLLEKCE